MNASAFYLAGETEPFLALYNSAAGDGAAVLLVPPLGWEDVCSYRPRRDWAEHLAGRGHPVLRIDLPGTADSAGGPFDPDRVERWTQSVADAAAWLRAETERRVVAIGIGAGGLFAWRAAAGGAPIDDLVLWGAPAKGAQLLRQLRAFAGLESATLGDQIRGDAAGTIVAGGFPLSAETAAALEAVDLAELPLPEAEQRRVLLLERDGRAPIRELGGMAGDVRAAPGQGYAEMMLEPQFAQTPTTVFEAVDAWLDAGGSEPTVEEGRPPERLDALDLGDMRETPFEVAGMFGILTEPTRERRSTITAVLLNAGSIRRIGPNRMWVEIARRWGAKGIATLRLDVRGIGDSDGDSRRFAEPSSYYAAPVVPELRAVFDALGGNLVLSGLCSGGYWAFQAALEDDRVVAAFLLNSLVLVWSNLLPVDRRLQPLRESLVRALRRGDVAELALAVRVVSRRIAARIARARGGDAIDRAFDRLRDTGKPLVLVYEDLDPQRWELERDGRLAALARWPNITLERVEGSDHTLRPPAMQEQAHAALDRALERLLGPQPPP